MAELSAIVAAHGYLALFVLGVAEFAALPVATIPILLAAGAVGAEGTLELPGVVVSVAAGGLVADLGWFSASRWRGTAVVDAACGLTARPDSCVLQVQHNVSRLGTLYVIFGKFIPGTAALLAAASGLTRIGWKRFLALDALALVLWATFYTGLGWILSDAVRPALVWMSGNLSLVLGGVALFIGGALFLRIRKFHAHRSMHEAALAGGDIHQDGVSPPVGVGTDQHTVRGAEPEAPAVEEAAPARRRPTHADGGGGGA